VLNEQGVELGMEVNPDEMAIIISGSQEDIGDKVVTADEPAVSKNVEDIKDQVVLVFRHRRGDWCWL
jgi:hypothetical protein